MEEILEVLRDHLTRYPEMKPMDCYKLIYQNERGPGHLVESEAEALDVLKKEWEITEADENMPLTESIGNNLCRLNIAKAKCRYTPEEINDIFMRTARLHRGRMAEFMHNMKLFVSHFDELPANFTEEELLAFREWYRGRAYPAVHHSPEYKAAYNPHYRVVYQGFADSLDIAIED